MTFIRSLTDLIPKTLNEATFGKILNVIEARLKAVENTKSDLEETIDSLQQVALDRIDLVLTPAIESVQALQNRGFLIAHSTTSATLGSGNIFTFVISDDHERLNFTPSPYVALTREANATDFGVARTVSYDREAGELLVEIVSFEGDAGPHTDWVIGALAGATVSMVTMHEEIMPAYAEMSTARDAAVDAADRAELAAASFEGAGVASVNGRSGIVTLDVSDIPNLQTDLAAKAPIADPLFSGNARAPTPGSTDSSQRIATTAWVRARGYLTEIANSSITFAKMASSALASASEFMSSAAGKILTAEGVWSAAQPVTIPYAATVSPNFATFINAKTTLGGNMVLGQPSGVKKGQMGIWEITQSASGGDTLSYDTTYWRADSGFALSSGANKTDYVTMYGCDDGKVLLSVLNGDGLTS